MTALTVLCVTQGEPYAVPFLRALEVAAARLRAELIFAVDGDKAVFPTYERTRWMHVRSAGYIESVLDAALVYCTGQYVLRIDDDEQISPRMLYWLEERVYEKAPHWKFPRTHLWGDRSRYIPAAPLWPDHQTRLSVRGMAGGRTTVHAGSPFGGGAVAPVAIEHHKFLVKTHEERRAIAAKYDAVQEGFGTGGMTAFNMPEDVWVDVPTAPLGHADDAARRDAEVSV